MRILTKGYILMFCLLAFLLLSMGACVMSMTMPEICFNGVDHNGNNDPFTMCLEIK